MEGSLLAGEGDIDLTDEWVEVAEGWQVPLMSGYERN